MKRWNELLFFCLVCIMCLGNRAVAQHPPVPPGLDSLEMLAFSLAEEQLAAYNNRDIEAFLRPYSDSIKIFDFPDRLISKGKDKMAASYAAMFSATPELHCELLNRMVMGNTVVDQERVSVAAGLPPFFAIAIYKIADGKIQEVYFMTK